VRLSYFGGCSPGELAQLSRWDIGLTGLLETGISRGAGRIFKAGRARVRYDSDRELSLVLAVGLCWLVANGRDPDGRADEK
jgi:hypothetical protein